MARNGDSPYLDFFVPFSACACSCIVLPEPDGFWVVLTSFDVDGGGGGRDSLEGTVHPFVIGTRTGQSASREVASELGACWSPLWVRRLPAPGWSVSREAAESMVQGSQLATPP